ncbi:MAG: cation-translocating P-type ATPase [Planctomycetes bacterium]|nr:cation-translocating P-type ATPase [Planctomycetota bacterium]
MASATLPSESASGDATAAEAAVGRALRLQIAATLVGATLLACSLVARFLWAKDFYPAIPAALAALLLGAPLVAAAVRDLFRGQAGMNALVALAVVGAAASGKYQESAAVALFMIVSGLIEKRTAIGAQASIESLVRLAPTKAHRLVAGATSLDGREEEVEAKDLRPGDRVRVRPGDTIPADGRVLTGTSTVNQASITGESLPADKLAGDEVFGGTINLTGALDIEVTKAGADTLLGRVKDLILQAERTRTPIMRLVDQYAFWYTPTVLMLVGVVLFFALRSDPETAFSRAIAMLVVACPSALILATPTAMVAALSAAARLGVLVKSVVTLEAARNLTAIVFDKTGTLTTGILAVTRLAPVEGVEGAELLRLAASVEQDSRHPVARAVTEMARRANLPLTRPDAFEEVPGRGVVATVAGSRVMVGRGAWLAGVDGGLAAAESRAIEGVQASDDAEGLSILFVVKDGRLLGWIGLEDNARPEAAEAVDRLRSLGLKRLVILTGDRRSVARRVAEQMHFSEFKAEVLPHEKLEMVDALKAQGHRVAVIGDGVNDAPALAAGDISIAMGAAGSDVAIHSATIALLNSNLNRVPFLIELSRRTIGVIRQNMVIGAAFIVVFLALAGAGYVSPVMAAFLHIVSGLIVVFNSARLVRCGEEIERSEAERLAEVEASRRRDAGRAARPG